MSLIIPGGSFRPLNYSSGPYNELDVGAFEVYVISEDEKRVLSILGKEWRHQPCPEDALSGLEVHRSDVADFPASSAELLLYSLEMLYFLILLLVPSLLLVSLLRLYSWRAFSFDLYRFYKLTCCIHKICRHLLYCKTGFYTCKTFLNSVDIFKRKTFVLRRSVYTVKSNLYYLLYYFYDRGKDSDETYFA